MEKSKEHIRHCLLYEYQLGHSAREATRNICQAIGEGSISPTTAWRWFERFRNNDFSLKDEEKSGANRDQFGRIKASYRERSKSNHSRCSKQG